MEQYSISPTMVFVDGDHRYAGIKSDLALLARYVRPGVPVLCHDYLNPDNGKPELGVRQAVDEWVQDGYARWMGGFGCSGLLDATGKSYENAEREFDRLREQTMQKKARHLAFREWVAFNVPFARSIWRRMRGRSSQSS